MTVEARMTKKIQDALSPERLEVINESHLHAGHQDSFDGTGETHFRIRIVSGAFSGMPRLQRHRTINELLQAELQDTVHALAIEPAAPGESVRW
ncbi:MAG: BolA family transcriptional regulator [Alphaproteobacteria bacterium]|nr:BolA family transcriptional regulator [Alphaproteobacteria bacterium]